MTSRTTRPRRHCSLVWSSCSKFRHQSRVVRSELLLLVIQSLRAAVVQILIKLRSNHWSRGLTIRLMEGSKAFLDGPIFFMVFYRTKTNQLTTHSWTMASLHPPSFLESSSIHSMIIADTSSSRSRCPTLCSSPLEPWTLISRTSPIKSSLMRMFNWFRIRKICRVNLWYS